MHEEDQKMVAVEFGKQIDNIYNYLDDTNDLLQLQERKFLTAINSVHNELHRLKEVLDIYTDREIVFSEEEEKYYCPYLEL